MKMYEERLKVAKEKFSKFIEETTIEDIKEKCNKSELDINSDISKIWTVDYCGGPDSEMMVDEFYDMILNDELIKSVMISPEIVFKKIYSVKNYKDENELIVLFNDNIFDMEKLNAEYELIQQENSLKAYLERYEQLPKEYHQEIYDPLDFIGQQAKLDELQQKLENKEISLIDVFKEMGYEGDYDKLEDIANDLINGKIGNAEIQEKLQAGELIPIELVLIQSVIEQFYPEVLEKLNAEE